MLSLFCFCHYWSLLPLLFLHYALQHLMTQSSADPRRCRAGRESRRANLAKNSFFDFLIRLFVPVLHSLRVNFDLQLVCSDDSESDGESDANIWIKRLCAIDPCFPPFHFNTSDFAETLAIESRLPQRTVELLPSLINLFSSI